MAFASKAQLRLDQPVATDAACWYLLWLAKADQTATRPELLLCCTLRQRDVYTCGSVSCGFCAGLWPGARTAHAGTACGMPELWLLQGSLLRITCLPHAQPSLQVLAIRERDDASLSCRDKVLRHQEAAD